MKREADELNEMNNEQSVKVFSLEKRRRNKRRRRIFKTVVIFLLLVILVVSVRFIPLFNIKNISVEGNTRYINEEIIATLGVNKEENAFELFGANLFNMFTFRYRNFEEIIREEFAYVDDVKVRYRPFGNMKILITEREPIGAFKDGNLYVVVDKDGNIVDLLNQVPKGMIVFKNVKFTYEERYGGKITLEDPAMLDGILTLKEAIKSQSKEMYNNITAMLISSTTEYKVVFKGRIIVVFGELDDLEYKAQFVEKVIKDNLGYKAKGTLDLTAKAPTFRASE